jgi:hypothetical protein
MNTKKSEKPQIFWRHCCEDSFFAALPEKFAGKYGVLIVKGFTSSVNVLCIFLEVEKDRIYVKTIPWLKKISFNMKNVLGFALLEMAQGRATHLNGNTLDNRRCNLRFPETEGKSNAKLPENWGKVV